ncbi:hypothetical protein PspLS_06292 [Pyricularia sp. CBS 133598]|nr:hypothetical protein PspLS_06292 [Pyricularia sp. CBS 133598]
MTNQDAIPAATQSGTIVVIGCGRLGTAVIRGILKTLENPNNSPLKLQNEPKHFILCVKTQESADRLEHEFARYTGTDGKATNAPKIIIYRGHNVDAALQAETVILGCQPQQLSGILSEDGMTAALRNKLTLSICAGFSADGIRRMLGVSDGILYPVVHAMPNVCSVVGQSTTVITETALSARHSALAMWVFGGVGTTTVVSEPLINAAGITAGCTPGFLGLVLQGLVAGAVRCGLDAEQALVMAAQAMKGTAHMVLDLSEDPAALTARVSTPGGCTEQGVNVLRAMAVTDAFDKAIVDAVARAFELAEQ